MQRLCGRHLCNACVKLKKESLLRLALFILVSTHKHTHAHKKQSHTEHTHTHTLTEHTHTHAHTHTRTHAHTRTHTHTHTHNTTEPTKESLLGAHTKRLCRVYVQSLCGRPMCRVSAEGLRIVSCVLVFLVLTNSVE